MIVTYNLVEGNRVILDDCAPHMWARSLYLRTVQGMNWFWIDRPSPNEKRQMSGNTPSTFQKKHFPENIHI
mgnify:CR=1 FL=1|jgi:hypothetical protein